MSTSLHEHRVALTHADDPVRPREIGKALALLRRLHRLQYLADHDRANSYTEHERAALLWALSELGVICGVLLEERRGANLRCVRSGGHPGECDPRLGDDT